ncbi:unnamed protein product [Rangifer tarandus platyrhynchus]|uniref:Uncharacterized protein n=1 Tax=Rangifer tarandus platyrhynchus TaxID=3082113 RepID=A0AC59YIU1_RANTA
MCPGESDKGAAKSLKRVSAHMSAAASRREQPLDSREFQKIRLSRIFCLEPLHPWPALRVYLLGGGNHPARRAAVERRRGRSPTASSHQTVQERKKLPCSKV